MTTYAAELDDAGTVLRVVVADSLDWCVEHLGGNWVETADPYADNEPMTYAGIGMGYDAEWPEAFAPAWKPWDGLNESLYQTGALVFHEGHIWRCTTIDNAFEPGTSGWHDAPLVGLPVWIQPTGGHDAYPLGAEVTHLGQNWRSTTTANVWPPGVFGWVAFL